MRCWIVAFLVVVAGMSGCKKGDGNVEPSTSGKKAPVVASDAAKPASEVIAPGPTMLERVNEAAGTFWKTRHLGPVQVVEPYANAGLGYWFPGKTFYRVRLYNPISEIAGPSWVYRLAMVDGDGITCMAPEDAVKLLAGKEPKDAAEALLLVQAWGALVGGYELINSPPAGPAGIPNVVGQAEKDEWALRVSREGKTWIVEGAFLTDASGGGADRMRVAISHGDGLQSVLIKSLCGIGYD